MDINRNEVLRYLGYRNQVIDRELNNLIDSCIDEIKDISQPHYTFEIFEVKKVDGGVKLIGTNIILKGNDISKHLEKSKKCAVLAATLGVGVDNRIRILSKTDITRSLILDACGTEAIEGVCNSVEDMIKQIAKSEGLNINFRYSPGYGDLSIDVQENIINLLSTQCKIGLTCTDSNIMLPRKSVTAIIGFVDGESKRLKKGCRGCRAFEGCLYRRDGIACGN